MPHYTLSDGRQVRRFERALLLSNFLSADVGRAFFKMVCVGPDKKCSRVQRADPRFRHQTVNQSIPALGVEGVGPSPYKPTSSTWHNPQHQLLPGRPARFFS